MFQCNHISPKNIPNERSQESGIKLDKVLNKGGNYCCYSKILLRIQNIFNGKHTKLLRDSAKTLNFRQAE